MKAYTPREYWDARLRAHWDLSGVGHREYTVAYNRWLYRAQDRAVGRVFHRGAVDVSGNRVLDVGSGTGYWLGWYRSHGAGSLCALELSPTAAEVLRRAFPEDEVVEANIAGPSVDLAPFEVVNVMNVLYHIVEPSLFERALANLASLTAPGGWLVLSDGLGSRELQPASHVRFRPLASYQDRLPQLGFAIKVVEPAYTLLNGGVAKAVRWAPSRVQRLVRRGEEALAPVLYTLDGFSMLARWANMRILVARKVFSTGG